MVDDTKELWRPGIGASRSPTPLSRPSLSRRSRRYVARAPPSRAPHNDLRCCASDAREGGRGWRAASRPRRGARGAARGCPRPCPTRQPMCRARAAAEIVCDHPSSVKGHGSHAESSSALSSARRRCARLRRGRARPSRRGFECSARTASAVASRAPRRTSRPRHGPGPAQQPTGPLVHLLHQGRAALARRDEAEGRRSDVARGIPYSRCVGPAPPGARGRPGAPPRGGDVERRQGHGRERGVGLRLAPIPGLHNSFVSSTKSQFLGASPSIPVIIPSDANSARGNVGSG